MYLAGDQTTGGGISYALDPNALPTDAQLPATDVADITVTAPPPSSLAPLLVMAFIVWVLWRYADKEET